MQIALEHNPQLRASATQFIRAKGQVLRLRSILYPSLSVQGLSTPLEFYTQINQVIYNHATFPDLRLGHLTEEQAIINYQQNLIDVVFQVRQSFIDVIATQQRVDIIQQFSNGKVKAIESAQQLFEAGKVQKSVVTNIQVQSGLFEKALADDKLSQTQARILLNNIVGEELPTTARFSGDFKVTLPEKLDTGQLIADALANREDLKLLENQQLSAEQQIQINMQSAYPVIGFSSNSTIQPPALGIADSLNAEANYNEPQTVVAAGQTQLPLSLYENWTFFDGGLTRGIKKSGEATIASREVALAALKQSITGEIGGAVSQILTQRKSLKAMDEQPDPEELRRLSQASYDAGQLRQLDMVNLENDILAQELLHLTAEYQLCRAAATLDHALGHGLKISQSAEPK